MYSEIKNYFRDKLVCRELPDTIRSQVHAAEVAVVSEIGLPVMNHLDIDYTDAILQHNNFLIIGKAKNGDTVYYNIESKIVFRETPDFFLASSLENLLKQHFIIDTFRNEIIRNEALGSYHENKKKYAEWLKSEMLKIDEQLFKKDTAYYWGGMVESVEQGQG